MATHVRKTIHQYLTRGLDLLRDCMPPRLRRWRAARRPVLLVKPRQRHCELLRQAGPQRQSLGALHLDAEAPLPAAARAAIRRQRWREVAVELPAAAVLLRSCVLPVQVRPRLHQVVGLEMNRLTPFECAEVYYHATAGPTLAGGTKLAVTVAVCPRRDLEHWLQHLASQGLGAHRLTWEGAGPDVNLLPAAAQAPRRRLGALLSVLLAALVLLLAVPVALTPLWQSAAQQRVLQAQLTDLRQRNRALAPLEQTLAQARAEADAVAQRLRHRPRITELLHQLTQRLPDDTWLRALSVEADAVEIRGESAQATALIDILERAPDISDVRYRSPVKQVRDDAEAEAFHIGFDYAWAVPQ